MIPSHGSNPLNQWAGPLILSAIVLTSCGDGPTEENGGGVPVVDGIFDADEWAGATALPITDPLFAGAPPGGTLFVTTDGTDLFIGVQMPAAEEVGDEKLFIRFDNDNDDVLTTGDDALSLGFAGFLGSEGFADLHYTQDNFSTPDLSVDGSGAYGSSQGLFFELQHPLNSGDPDDLALAPGSVIGVCLRYWRNNGFQGGGFPNGCIFQNQGQALYLDVVVERP